MRFLVLCVAVSAAAAYNEVGGKDWSKVNPCLAEEHAPCNGCGTGGPTKWCCKRSGGAPQACSESTYVERRDRL